MVDTKYFVDAGDTTFREVGLSNDTKPRRNARYDAYDEDEWYDARSNDPYERRKNFWKSRDIYAHYDGIIPDDCDSLDSQQYMICAPTVMAFVLKARRIGKPTRSMHLMIRAKKIIRRALHR